MPAPSRSPSPPYTRQEEWRAAIADLESVPDAMASRLTELRNRTAAVADHLSNGFLRSCLRARWYDVDKASKVVQHYLAFRSRHASWLLPCHAAASSKRSSKTGFNELLPSQDAAGHVVITQRMGLLETGRPGVIERHQRAGYYLLHSALQREGAQTRGLALLLDFGGFRWSAFRQISYSDIQRGVGMLQDAMPARLSVIYVLHPPTWLTALVSLLTPLLRKDTLQQKFVLLDDASKLHKYMAPSSLPAGVDGWGGTAPREWSATVDGWIAEEEAARASAGFDPAVLVQ